jgi:hypothetical protein
MVVNGFGILNPSSGIATAYATLADFLVSQSYDVTVVYVSASMPIGFAEAIEFYRNKSIKLIRFSNA